MSIQLPDELLAERAARGHTDAFEELLGRYRAQVYRICYRMAGNAEDAEDWAQECFVRVYRHLDAYEPERPFRPWLLRVVSNSCVSLAKARALQRSRFEWGAPPEEARAARSSDPAHAVLTGDEARRINVAVAALPPGLRQAVLLRVQEGLSFRELAETLEVPLQTAAARVRRALEQVRARLRDENVEAER